MLTKITACFFAALFLMGSTFLPLGDFSLMRDVPGMYRAYEKLAPADEIGIIDFVGDYLFAGKALLGHNKNDKAETAGLSVQFQHSPVGFNFLCSTIQLPYLLVQDFKIIHTLLINPVEISGFHPELFRPPLV